MSVAPPISIFDFAKAGWNFFSQVTPKPTSVTRMVAIGMIVSAVALVLIAKISLVAGFALTLGAYTLVNHADLQACAEAQKALESKLRYSSRDLDEILQNIKQDSQITRFQKGEVMEQSSNLGLIITQMQQYLDAVNASVESIKITSSSFDSKLNQHEGNFKLLDKAAEDSQKKIATLQISMEMFQENTKSFQENIDILKRELLNLESTKDQIQEVYNKIHELQDEGRNNAETLSGTIRETASRLEAVASSMEQNFPLLRRIESMDKRLSECWELSQKIRQEQQAPRMAPVQQFQQVVRTAAGMQYRR
jgi:chromosome segregation ATPase